MTRSAAMCRNRDTEAVDDLASSRPLAPATMSFPTALWSDGSLVSVVLVEVPPRAPDSGICDCPACRSASLAGIAVSFH